MLDGLIDRLEEELGESVSPVLTGGVSPLVVPYCRHTFHLEPDILIDGPFIMAKKSLELKFRGSWNQRIIDVQKSLVEGHVVIHQIQLDEMAEHPDREYNT